MVARPFHRTHRLHPDVDVEAALQAYEAAGWTRDHAHGSLCTINGVPFRLVGMSTFGDQRDPGPAAPPYDVPPGWAGPLEPATGASAATP